MTLAPDVVAADLRGSILPKRFYAWRAYLPGLTIVTLATLAAAFLSDHYGPPLTLMALLLGLSLNFLSTDQRLTPGLDFSSRSLLRWGIVLAGVRVTAGQVIGLGPLALVCVITIVVVTLGTAILLARRFGFGSAFGALVGGSVAICGASAAMALAATLGERRISEAQLTLVLVGIATMSAGAMVLYPVIAHMLSMSDLQAGFLLGASIHDVAQALGAGYGYSEEAGQIAAIVKLTRVALLAPLLALIALLLPSGGEGPKGMGVPWFIIGFFVLAGVNSTGVVPPVLSQGSANMADALLAVAVTATAIRSPLPQLKKVGPKPLLIIVAVTMVAFLCALLAVLVAFR